MPNAAKQVSRTLPSFALQNSIMYAFLIPNAAKQVSRTLSSFALQNSIKYDKMLQNWFCGRLRYRFWGQSFFTHAGVLAVFKPRRGRLKIPVAPTGKLKLHVFPLRRAKENKGFALSTPTSPFLKGLTPKSIVFSPKALRKTVKKV